MTKITGKKVYPTLLLENELPKTVFITTVFPALKLMSWVEVRYSIWNFFLGHVCKNIMKECHEKWILSTSC